MAGDFAVPDRAQEQLMREVGLDPERFAVVRSSEDLLWLLHYKSHHEVVVHINRRILHDHR